MNNSHWMITKTTIKTSWHTLHQLDFCENLIGQVFEQDVPNPPIRALVWTNKLFPHQENTTFNTADEAKKWVLVQLIKQRLTT